MTPKDFELIARTLKQSKDYKAGKPAHAQWNATVLDFAKTLAETNQHFNRTRFLLACGYEGDI